MKVFANLPYEIYLIHSEMFTCDIFTRENGTEMRIDFRTNNMEDTPFFSLWF